MKKELNKEDFDALENGMSMFVEYLGDSPYIRVLDFLLTGQMFDYSMTEVARGAHVGWGTFTKIWAYLFERKMIVPTREVGNAKLFTLNRENPIVKKLIQLDWELMKLAPIDEGEIKVVN